jgi:hypothetical protein
MRILKLVHFAALCLFTLSNAAAQSTHLYGPKPGKANANIDGDTITLKNDFLSATWSTSDNSLRGGSLASPSLSASVKLPEYPFLLLLPDQKLLAPDFLKISKPPVLEEIASNSQSSRLEDHFPGKRVTVGLSDPAHKLNVTWSATLRDEDNYVRQEITISAGADLPIREVRLFDFDLPSAKVEGQVQGSPVVAGNLFLGFEHPLSQCSIDSSQVRCGIQRELPIKAGQRVSYSSVVGVAPAGQMRRAFLNYVERTRAHPYRTFLHYNSWYDIGYGNRYDQAAALDAIRGMGEELTIKRSVKIDSFLFDDGWDDTHSLWNFDSGFPDGFARIKIAAGKYKAAPGIWLSPWGGYDEAKEQRLKYAKEQGFETNEGGFALSAPRYFALFRQVTLDFIRRYGINQFKIDGTGNVNSVFAGSEFDSDFHAAISLIQQWRTVKPDIFVNLTTGTYPSPFWLQYADSIWRGGEDHSFAGVGPWREKWITYRDADTYAGIVKKGPLFPLNSLMLHGIIYAKHAEHLTDDPDHVFIHEVRDYFGTGTQLQEMYITHSLLSASDWEAIAESANWSRQNAETLSDTHWIGGDPAKLEPYGWASWSPQKGIITLRNPSDQPQTFSLDVSEAFELPSGAPRKFKTYSPWKSGAPPDASQILTVGESHNFTLKAFEVLTLEAVPQ